MIVWGLLHQTCLEPNNSKTFSEIWLKLHIANRQFPIVNCMNHTPNANQATTLSYIVSTMLKFQLKHPITQLLTHAEFDCLPINGLLLQNGLRNPVSFIIRRKQCWITSWLIFWIVPLHHCSKRYDTTEGSDSFKSKHTRRTEFICTRGLYTVHATLRTNALKMLKRTDSFFSCFWNYFWIIWYYQPNFIPNGTVVRINTQFEHPTVLQSMQGRISMPRTFEYSRVES